MCHHFLRISHRTVSPSDFNLLRTPIARITIIAIIVALKDHLALLACQSGSGREVYNTIINIIPFNFPNLRGSWLQHAHRQLRGIYLFNANANGHSGVLLAICNPAPNGRTSTGTHTEH